VQLVAQGASTRDAMRPTARENDAKAQVW